MKSIDDGQVTSATERRGALVESLTNGTRVRHGKLERVFGIWSNLLTGHLDSGRGTRGVLSSYKLVLSLRVFFEGFNYSTKAVNQQVRGKATGSRLFFYREEDIPYQEVINTFRSQ